MTALEFRIYAGLADKSGATINVINNDKSRKFLIDRIESLEKDLELDNSKYREVFKIHEWENLKARIFYQRLNLELNKILLDSLRG